MGRDGRVATRPGRSRPRCDHDRPGHRRAARVGAPTLAGAAEDPASARTIALPPFLVAKLRYHLAGSAGPFVFTSPQGYPLRRSTFDRRVFRPAVDGEFRKGTYSVRPGLTFHGLRHSNKTWLIADGVPEIAQAKRLGHHLANRLVEVYSHVAPEIETRLLQRLERRWKHAIRNRRPADKRRRPAPRQRDPHTAPRSAPPHAGLRVVGIHRSTPTTAEHHDPTRPLWMLQNCSRSVHNAINTDRGCHHRGNEKRAPTSPYVRRRGTIKEWS